MKSLAGNLSFYYSSFVQNKVVNEAVNSIEMEIGTTEWPKETIEKYFNYLFSIGFHYGRKLIGHGKPVKQSKDGIVIAIYPSATDAARAMHCSTRSIIDSCNGLQKYKKFDWEYLKLDNNEIERITK